MMLFLVLYTWFLIRDWLPLVDQALYAVVASRPKMRVVVPEVQLQSCLDRVLY